ncbi:hypothetical protein [Edaphobacter albus]|uniref:hypothetical protein n=1 Tax=Edaphobacter sp. 4G125 TaxID=2763071 RepID=UPI001646995F|nr:hypothetical protein [Edaphobacter sp. 4G125]QNI35873.1 hypothetical protein H7846_12645 [Edaphobacter sp. 4G125]
MNEATFESHLATALLSLFPTPLRTQVETQRVFTLKLGHNTFEIDARKTLQRGRGDVILSVAEKPTVLLELKGPEIALTDEDVEQGLSYARLHRPMIPLLAVTNGASTELYATFDGKKLDGTSIDEKVLAQVLQRGSQLASSAREEAIRSIIGGSPETWAAALRAETKRLLEDLKAQRSDFTKPLSSDFSLPRRATAILGGGFSIAGEKALALVGPPLSGKTNVIAELCCRAEEFSLAPLYIDCMEASDLLEEISRALTDSLGTSIPRDQVYDWLRLGMGTTGDDRPRLLLILDSLFPSDSAELMKQASQLLGSAGDKFSILYALTDGDWDRVRSVPGRMTLSKLGRHAKAVMMRELTDDELEVAQTNLREGERTLLPNPEQFELSMRQPHILRLMMSLEDDKEEMPEGMVRRVPPVLPTTFLRALWDRTATSSELRADYLALANCYFQDSPARQQSVHLTAIGMGIGVISLEGAQAHLTSEVFNRLLAQGHIKRIPLLSSVVIVPTVPELLSAACVPVLMPMLLKRVEMEGEEAATNALLRWTRSLALGDRVAASVLIDLALRDAALFFEIAGRLMELEPHEELKDSGNFLMQAPGGHLVELIYDGDALRLKFEDGTEQELEWPEDEGPLRLLTDIHPWQILSHLSYAGIAINQEPGPVLIAPSIFMRVGKFRATLRDVGRPSFEHASSVYEHALPGYGSVPCPARGIVEAITYGMHVNMLRYGDAMDEHIREAIADGDPALLMRLYVAARSLDGIADTEVATRVARVTKELHSALNKVFSVIEEEEHAR